MDGSTKRFPLTFTYLLKICKLLEIESNKEEEPFGGAVSLTALPLDLILPLQASQQHRLLPWPLEEQSSRLGKSFLWKEEMEVKLLKR